jgi:hypothetical protein
MDNAHSLQLALRTTGKAFSQNPFGMGALPNEKG